ncbi:MAG: glycoside hydrolase family 5 protein [Ruminiclostridium sp.]|nr:glycoside hydrolase family 5 protein [Ruminiclostridium sp.]
MKKLLRTVFLAFALVVTGSCAGGATAVSQRAETTAAAAETAPDTADEAAGTENEPAGTVFSLTAAEAAAGMGVGLNLGNTMEAYEAHGCEKISYEWIPEVGSNTPSDYETCWGAPVTTQEMIDGIRDAGFSTVRIPVFWGNMMKNDGSWTIAPEYLARVKEIVDYCMNDGLYAVVNIHHFDEFVIRRNDLESCTGIFTTLWTQIAGYFKDYPETLVFEGFNEYLGGDRFNSSGELTAQSKSDAYLMTNTLNQTFVDAVRATGGNNAGRVLIVSGYWTNIDNTTSDKFTMPTDSVPDRLMVSVHYVDNSMYWEKRIGSKKWLDYTDSQIALLDKAFGEKGIPVFLGETTSRYPRENFASDAEHTDSSECLGIVLDKLTSHGFVPVLWDTPGGFYNRQKCSIGRTSDAEVIAQVSEKLRNS